MSRLISVAAGLLLVAVAFLAAAQVADTQQGLIAEVITLMSGLIGVLLLLYGLIPKRRTSGSATPRREKRPGPTLRSANDLLIGTAGLLLAIILIGGLVLSGGWGWAALGAVLMVPMVAGCAYLVVAFVRAPARVWTVDLHRLLRSRTED
jgi:Trk-type K+ transport system membrane component